MNPPQLSDREFQAAFFRTHGAHPLSGSVLDVARDGWTTAGIETVESLSYWALDNDTHLGRPDISLGDDRDERMQMVYFALEGVGNRFMKRGGLVDQVALPWLAVAAGANSWSAHAAVGWLAISTLHGVSTTDREQTALTAWRRTGPGPYAALAYAAGLTPDEALTRRRSRTWDPESLTVLAALRGYLIPPSLLEQM